MSFRHISPMPEFTSPRARDLVERMSVMHDKLHTMQAITEDLVPVRPITVDELAWTNFGNEQPEYVGNCTLPKVDSDGVFRGAFHQLCHVHVYNDGTAVAFDRQWKHDYPLPKGVTKNVMTVRFWAVGCNHKYRPMTTDEIKGCKVGPLFSHDHAYICDGCGHHYVVDSSG